jgi:hypothetical protein
MLSSHLARLVPLIADLPALIVKGPVFARRLYPERGLRRFTDIDILAGDDAIPTLGRALAGLGFRLAEAEPEDNPQEWKWSHEVNDGIIIEVHKNLVHAQSLRGAMSLTYRDIAGANGREAAERPSTLLAIAGVHGATHNFERLVHLTDILQAARALDGAGDESHLEDLIGRTGTRLAVVAGLDLAGRLFDEPRCLWLARELRPGRYARGARWLLNRAVVVSAMDERRHAYSWRRAAFRELIKRRQ